VVAGFLYFILLESRASGICFTTLSRGQSTLHLVGDVLSSLRWRSFVVCYMGGNVLPLASADSEQVAAIGVDDVRFDCSTCGLPACLLSHEIKWLTKVLLTDSLGYRRSTP
jgi:hypothetical protein